MRTLGPAGLASSSIGLGTAAFTGIYGPVSRSESLRTAMMALDMGITLFDTADAYSDGEIEVLLGRALSGRRDDALIAVHGGAHVSAALDAIAGSGARSLASACDASLRRLG